MLAPNLADVADAPLLQELGKQREIMPVRGEGVACRPPLGRKGVEEGLNRIIHVQRGASVRLIQRPQGALGSEEIVPPV